MRADSQLQFSGFSSETPSGAAWVCVCERGMREKRVLCLCVVGACSLGLAAFGPPSPIPPTGTFDLVFCLRARHTVYHPWLTGVGGGRPGTEVASRTPSAPSVACLL